MSLKERHRPRPEAQNMCVSLGTFLNKVFKVHRFTKTVNGRINHIGLHGLPQKDTWQL